MKTFTEEEVKVLLKEVMNLGMSLREDQLSGHSDKSGNEVLDEYWKSKMKNEQVPEWMNPESDNYYKGYRYEKGGNFEFWYDSNNVLRKERGYNKTYECYWDENGYLHNEDGPAYQEWDYKGNLIINEYWLNGINLTKDNWKVKITKSKNN